MWTEKRLNLAMFWSKHFKLQRNSQVKEDLLNHLEGNLRKKETNVKLSLTGH